MGKPGKYRIEVDKVGFGKISEHLKGIEVDGQYTRIYHGDDLDITHDNTEINYSVPVDPEGKEEPAVQLIRESFIRAGQHIISLIGLGATGISFIVSPTPMIGGFLVLHVGFYAISHKFSKTKISDTFGVVTDNKSGDAIKNIVVRVFDNAYHKLIETKLTDAKGRYAMLVGPSEYYVTYEKPGYKKKQSKVMDFVKDGGGMIARDETMVEGGYLSEKEKLQFEKEKAEASAVASEQTSKRKEEGEAGEAMGEHVDPEQVISQWKKDHGLDSDNGVQSTQRKKVTTKKKVKPAKKVVKKASKVEKKEIVEPKEETKPVMDEPKEEKKGVTDEDLDNFINSIKDIVL